MRELYEKLEVPSRHLAVRKGRHRACCRQTEGVTRLPMALDLNDPDLELSDLLFAYQTWVLAVLNDEKLNPEGEKLATDEISEDAMNALRFLPAEVTSTVESTLALAYDVDADELTNLLFPEG